MVALQADPIRDYRRDVGYASSIGLIVGIVFLLLGLFFGDWFTIVGALVVILFAVRYWIVDLTPNQVIAERLKEKEQEPPKWGPL